MRIAYVAAAIVLATCGAGAAAAADVAQLDCPTTRLSDRDRAAFVEAVSERASPSDPRFAGFVGMVDDCARNHGWSPDAIAHARVYNLSVAGQAATRRQLESLGVDVASIERALLADTALIAATGSDRYPEERMRAFIERLDPSVDEIAARQPAGTDVATPLGMFIVFRAVMESSRTQFAAN